MKKCVKLVISKNLLPHVSTLLCHPQGACSQYLLRYKSVSNAAVGDKGKGLPQQAEVAQGVPGRLRPQIITTFGTTRVVGRQPNASAAFTP